MKIILINGPARSGKDSLATAFAQHAYSVAGRKVEVIKFAMPLKEMAHRMFGLPEKHDSQEAVKDQPSGLLFGKTPREVYIAVSERLMKPVFGNDIFGRLLVQEIETIRNIDFLDGEETDYFVVSDSGFSEEAAAVVDHFGAENVVLVQLTREGYTFAGDSRSYISLPGVRNFRFDFGPNLRHLKENTQLLFAALEVRS